MQTVFIRITIQGQTLRDVIKLKDGLDELLVDYPDAAVEVNIVKRPNMGYPASLPRPPGD